METLDKLIDEYEKSNLKQPRKVVEPGFEKISRLEPVKLERKQRNNKRAKTSPDSNQDLSLEAKLSVDAIRMRSTLTNNRFYKKKATETISDKFSIGTVIDHPIDYHSRATRKERKQALIDELIADSKLKKFRG